MFVLLVAAESALAQSPDPITAAPGVGLRGAMQDSALLGGVPSGEATDDVIRLSLDDAINRGLKFNLGILLGRENVVYAEGARGRAKAELLPSLSMNTYQMREQINLAALGFGGFPGIPAIIGPFDVFDTRLYLKQPILDLKARNAARSEASNLAAVQHSFKDTRDLVVLICGNLYLDAVAGQTRIEAARAQLQTAQALYDLAVDRKKAGLAAGIDELRARVQLQSQQQRMIVAENDFAKQKLTLARAIGLPVGQKYALTDEIPYVPLTGVTQDDALVQAYQNRGDYLSAQERVRAAELERKAVGSERIPKLDFDADYGIIGSRVNVSHGTFSVAANLRFPIFDGGKIHSREIEADAVLRQRQAAVDDLRARIHYEIQSTFLDLRAADERVHVAQSSLDLAKEEIRQVQDRFSAGVATSVEVVQSQEALANASENYISSLYTFNASKAALARSMGVAEDAYQKFLRGK